MLLLAPVVPLVAGLLLWPAGRSSSRGVLGTVAIGAVLVAGALIAAASPGGARSSWSWGGPLEVSVATTAPVLIAAFLVVGVTVPVLAYATWYERTEGRSRLLGLLTAFAGAMLLLVLAADLLTLSIGFELTAAASWGLIAHEWRRPDVGPAAAHAFNVTRLGGLGLLVSAGAALAGVGSLRFDALDGLQGWPLHAFVIGIVLAAATKSALLPFSPWLFSAMGGPTPVSALLHSAAMVAAGAWTLIRLQEPLHASTWFGPTVIALGLATAAAGGIVASTQPRAKHLLAASTSAHYGFIAAAVGAGAAGAALAHLVAHAAAKALLFLVAGVAITATGSHLLSDHRVGRWRGVAAVAWVGALALAAVPPLGAGWTKETIVAAVGHAHPAWAVLAAFAGGLAAFYALRFAVLVAGRPVSDQRDLHEAAPGGAARAALGWLAAGSLLLGLLWVTPRHTVMALTGLPIHDGHPWEVALSLGLVAVGALAVRSLARRDRLAELTTRPAPRRRVADWLGLPDAARRLVVDPTLRAADLAASLDDRVVDAGVEVAGRAGQRLAGLWSGVSDLRVDRVVHAIAGATAALATGSAATDERGVDRAVDATAVGVGEAGRDLRRTQTGLVHHYYAYVVGGLVVAVVVLALLR